MGHHNHSHSHGHSHTFGSAHTKNYNRKKMQNTIILAMFLVFIFMIIEFVGGYLSNSIALMADAGHMLTDFISLIFALVGLLIAQRPNNKNKTYGYSRFEIIMSLINALFLIVVCIYIVYEAILRFYNPVVVNPKLMLPVAISGLIINFVVMYIFNRTEKKNREAEENSHLHSNGKNLLMESAFLHFIADTLGSVVAIIVAITIYYTNWYIVDPILSIILVILISNGTFRVIFRSINILMESVPKNIKSEEIETYLEKNITGLLDIHHIHLWMLNEEESIITLHAVIAKNANYHNITEEIKHALKEKFYIEHSTVQVEEVNKSCLDKGII